MATYKVVDADQLNADMTSVADSIRTKGGTTEALAWPDGYKTAIDSIPAGSAPSLQSKSVTYTANGTNTVTADDGYDGLSSVDVTVDVSGSGGGGGEDTVTVTLPIGPDKMNFDKEVNATYTNALGEIVANVPAGKAASYTVKKGSIFFIYGYLRDLASLSSLSLYGMAGDASTDPRFISNNKTGVFFVCDSDVTVVY